MKPLTIEELKSLEVGDWVWVVYVEHPQASEYIQKSDKSDNEKYIKVANIPFGGNLFYYDYGKTWTAFKNKEQAESKGEIVELPKGWLDTLKLLTCAASCYAAIDDMIAKGMQNSKELGYLFMKIPRVQGSTLQWSLQDLANNNIDCDKIQGFDEVLNAMPRFKAHLAKLQKD